MYKSFFFFFQYSLYYKQKQDKKFASETVLTQEEKISSEKVWSRVRENRKKKKIDTYSFSIEV